MMYLRRNIKCTFCFSILGIKNPLRSNESTFPHDVKNNLALQFTNEK